ncbi:MAG TPA: (2Fe-2S)-binding protein [Polyangia bacterium]|jgi:carbon-monoxide dehydrogenase small subunit
MESVPLSLVVNGAAVSAEVPADRTLLRFLRDDLGLTGAKEGCGEGECGACTVLLDGEPVCSCLTLALQAAGRTVVTIEGLGAGAEVDPVQQAFIDAGAIQCGFCTPGMILAAKGLLAHTPHPSPGEIRTALAGNLCRCTGYAKIVEAVATAPVPAK